ncbi:MAG TPA: CheR family methyltransferase [Vicinamibacterales bacterium]|nr:CheR family methyltransferase [Vicinamibacterales bacterium]
MTDTECVSFLQWALPRLGLRWRGFRKVRGQVCKRVERRMRILGTNGPAAYMAYLDAHPDEWHVLDGLCTISISRFYRDHRVFDALGDTVLPTLAARATRQTDTTVRCWSAGCASGEEPYTLSLIWAERIRPHFPQAVLVVVATDIDDVLLERARVACYPRSSLRELPPAWIDTAFARHNDEYCLGDPWKACVEFRLQDVRTDSPAGPFDLVLCRNVAFTYFEESVQQRIVSRLAEAISANGFLVVGRHESLPSGAPFVCDIPGLGIYRQEPDRC